MLSFHQNVEDVFKHLLPLFGVSEFIFAISTDVVKEKVKNVERRLWAAFVRTRSPGAEKGWHEHDAESPKQRKEHRSEGSVDAAANPASR